jgi:hypothetical protein
MVIFSPRQVTIEAHGQQTIRLSLRRPANLPRRTQPPPQRQSPPDLRYLIYVGIALAAVLAALFTPYLIAYLLQAMNGG